MLMISREFVTLFLRHKLFPLRESRVQHPVEKLINDVCVPRGKTFYFLSKCKITCFECIRHFTEGGPTTIARSSEHSAYFHEIFIFVIKCFWYFWSAYKRPRALVRQRAQRLVIEINREKLCRNISALSLARILIFFLICSERKKVIFIAWAPSENKLVEA